MRLIAVIEDQDVIKKILKNLGSFWFEQDNDLSCQSIASYTAQNERLRYAILHPGG